MFKTLLPETRPLSNQESLIGICNGEVPLYKKLLISRIVTLTYCFYSDGVGRTGTFIAIHSQLERLKTEGVVDIFQAVKSARIQRSGLVPEPVRQLM